MNRSISPLVRAAVMAGLFVPAAATAQSAAERSLSIGDSGEGEITAQDPTDTYRGQPHDVWTFEAEAGDGVSITMRSDAFDTYLVLLGPDGGVVAEDDDGAGELNSMIMTRIAVSGRYEIAASSYGSGEGAYTLTVERVDPSGLLDPTRAIQITPIAFGDDVEGSLDRSDALYRMRDAFSDTYAFEAEAGTPIDISMQSDAFDTFIALIGPNGSSIATDDDGGQGVNSHLQTTATADGTYRIVATSFSGDITGPYTLSLRNEHRSPTEGATELATGASTSVAIAGGTGAAWFEGSVGEPMLLHVEGEGQVYVEAYDTAGAMAGYGDTSSGQRVFRVAPTADGPVVATLSSWEMQDGAISLRLEPEPPMTIEPGRLRVGRSAEGEFTETDARSTEGAGFVDVYTLELEPGDEVTVSATGAGAMPTLRVVSPLAETLWNDGTMPFSGTSSRQVIRASVGGQYLITVSSWATGETYTLEVIDGVEPAAEWPGVTTTPIMDDVPVSASITSDDPVHPERGTGMDVYPLEVEDNALIEVTMTSDAFDTYLEIRDADGEIVASNDDYDGLNSFIRTSLGEGSWQIVATQYAGGEGEYSLIVSRSESSGATVVPIALGESIEAQLAMEQIDEWTSMTSARAAVDLEAGVPVTVSAMLPGGWVSISLVDEHGVTVAVETSDGEGPAAFSVSPPRAGHYTLLAQGESREARTVTITIAEGNEAPMQAPYSNMWGGGWDSGIIDEPYIDPMLEW